MIPDFPSVEKVFSVYKREKEPNLYLGKSKLSQGKQDKTTFLGVPFSANHQHPVHFQPRHGETDVLPPLFRDKSLRLLSVRRKHPHAP